MKKLFFLRLCLLILGMSLLSVSGTSALNWEKYFKGPVLHQNTITQIVLNPQDQALSSLTNITAWDIGDLCTDSFFQIDALSENASANITASESFARNSSSGLINKVCGSISKVETQDGSNSTNMVGQEIDLVTDPGSVISNLTGLLIRSAISVAPSGTFFGLDFSKPAVGTLTDIRLQNGETISNIVDGQIDLSGNLTTPNLFLSNPLSVSSGGTGLDSSILSGIPKVTSGIWSINATQDNLPDGTTYKQYNPASVSITGGSVSGITDLAVDDGGTGASDVASARSNLGLGSISTQNSDAVSITGGSVSGITDLALVDGGTEASSAVDARTNLGLGSMATQNADSVSVTGGSISGITDLAIADGGTGASDAASARSNLGIITAFGEAYLANNSVATSIKTANSPVMVRHASVGVLIGFTFDPGSTGSITAYLDGSGKVDVNSTAHGLESGDCISITGTTNYNGVWEITTIDADHFSIPATWVSDDGSSDWCEGSNLIVGAGGAGHYIMSFNFSCSEGGGAGSDILCETYVNCVPCPKCISKRNFANNDYGALVGQSVIDLVVGDRVYFTLSSSGTNDLTLEYGNFNLHLL